MTESSSAHPGPTDDGYRWVVLMAATIAQAGTAFVFLGVGALAGFIQEDFGLSGAQTGLLVTAVALAPLIALLPIGRMLDRGSERAIITGGALLLAVGTGLAAGANSYLSILLMLFLGGAGYSASQPGGSKVVASWFPPHQRGFAMGVRQTGLPLGGALAAAILPAIADGRGWGAAMRVAAATAAVTGVAFAAAYRPGMPPPVRSGRPFGAEIRELLAMGPIRRAMLAGLAMVAIQLSIVSYLMLYARDVHEIPLARGAWLLFAAQAAGVLGRVALAAWSDRIRSRMTPVVVAAVAAGAGAVAYGTITIGFTLTTLLVVTSAIGFFAFGWYGPWVVFVAEAAPRHAVGLTLALAMTANQTAIVAAPPIFGLLLDISGGYTLPWMTLGGFLLMAALVLSIRRSTPQV